MEMRRREERGGVKREKRYKDEWKRKECVVMMNFAVK